MRRTAALVLVWLVVVGSPALALEGLRTGQTGRVVEVVEPTR
jgi:hypothetical protein